MKLKSISYILAVCGMLFSFYSHAQFKGAVLKIDKPIYKFGFVKEGAIVLIRYAFQNTGTDTLRINHIAVTCGCTVADFPTYSILPGDSGVIQLSFDTKDKYDRQDRTVEVFSNAVNSPTKLRFKGVVRRDKSKRK